LALWAILDNLLKENRFIFKGTAESPGEYTVIAFYSRYDDNLDQEITSVIFLKDFPENDRTQFLLTVNGIGWDEAIKTEVDKDFGVLVSAMRYRLEPSRIKVFEKL
jgi:hypothetical protein